MHWPSGIISQRLLLIQCYVGRVLTIDDLPDDDLIEIFDFYVVRYQYLGFRQLNEFGI